MSSTTSLSPQVMSDLDTMAKNFNTLYPQLSKAINLYLAGGTGSAGTSTGTGTGAGTGTTGTGASGSTVPTDTNSYPLAAPAGAGSDKAVTIGTGPDTLYVEIANNAGVSSNTFSLIAKGGHFGTGTEVVGSITVTSTDGMVGGFPLTVKGVFRDATEIDVSFQGAVNGPWINNVQVNGMPFAATGSYDSRGSQTINQTGSLFVSNGATLVTFFPYNANGSGTGAGGTGTATPPATLTQISGATINGATVTADTLANIVAKIPSGGKLVLPAGKILGTATVSVPCTISGAGMGKTIIDGTGVSVAQDKGLFCPSVPGVTISNLTIQNASGPSANEAGVRDASDGVGFTLNAVEITGCFNGILTENGNITLTGCNIHGNGIGPGNTHNIYASITNVLATSTLTITNCTISGAVDGHEVKSRHAITNISGSTITTGGSGSAVDIPEGGAVSISNSTLTLGTGGAGDRNLICFAEEGALNVVAGNAASQTMTMNTVKLVDQTGGGIMSNVSQANAPLATLGLSGVTYSGTGPAPNFSGFKTVNGTPAKA